MAVRLIQTQWGWVGVAASCRGITRVLLPHQDQHFVLEQLQKMPEDASPDAQKLVEQVAQKLLHYFAGKPVEFNEPIDFMGQPAFYRRVWAELQAIPRGTTISYAELAALVGNPKAARAVGGAMANNPVPVLIPCHRVVRKDGSLGGFGGGLALKQEMLRLEAD